MIEAQNLNFMSLAYGCVEPKNLVLAGDHLLVIFNEVTKIITEYKPDIMAIEELYFLQNVTTGLRVAEARGVAILAARQALIPIAEYKPNMIKSTVAGYGHATKPQMQKMVQIQLKLATLPKPDDAADGLAIAICHAIHLKTIGR